MTRSSGPGKLATVARSEHHTGYWRVKLVLHYEGRDFHGWQIQEDRRTVQGELSALLRRICGEGSRKLTAAGRTDAGAHATGQVASALIPVRFDEGELLRALNALAPPDLWIASAERVPDSFHPRYDAVSRTYIYRVGVDHRSGSPFQAPWCWPLGRALDLELMVDATHCIIGDHDFSAFAKSGQPLRGVRCEVLAAEWSVAPQAEGILEFEITADRFLHRMVRYLVGTLVEIGQRFRPVDDMARLLGVEPGVKAAPPAPAQGLFLARVEYSTDYTEDRARGQGGSE
ncbi:MAG: tRNA pseudouridine(38-40) synthase TruA [Gemmatimonadota bacterium]|nr:MAG: tRNA pseudouridine(38-40) synthase TruA [Gemmatimonadota bacterium]